MDRNVTIFDRRAVQRRRVLYAANARLLGSEEALDCVVRSVSDIGAAVAFRCPRLANLRPKQHDEIAIARVARFGP